MPLSEQTVNRDPRVGFVSYVMSGSLALGRTVAEAPGGQANPACATCHGADLRGSQLGAPLAGQHPLYIYRQLNDIKLGNRHGGNTALMMPVVSQLDEPAMVALAAYIGALSP